jgi:hypothetical protein
MPRTTAQRTHFRSHDVRGRTKATLVKQFHKSYPLYAQVEDEAMNELFLRTGVFLDCWPDIVVSFFFFFFLLNYLHILSTL